MSETARPTGRHPVNIGHLVMGLAFLGLVGVWALVQGDVVDGGDIRWLLPVPWVVAGIAGLVATTLTSRDRWGTHHTGWVGEETTSQSWGSYRIGWVGEQPTGQTTSTTTQTSDTETSEEDR